MAKTDIKLTDAQAKMLLSKFNTGEFSGGINRIATINKLKEFGLIALDETRDFKFFKVTDSGKLWCFENHMNF